MSSYMNEWRAWPVDEVSLRMERSFTATFVLGYFSPASPRSFTNVFRIEPRLEHALDLWTIRWTRRKEGDFQWHRSEAFFLMVSAFVWICEPLFYHAASLLILEPPTDCDTWDEDHTFCFCLNPSLFFLLINQHQKDLNPQGPRNLLNDRSTSTCLRWRLFGKVFA